MSSYESGLIHQVQNRLVNDRRKVHIDRAIEMLNHVIESAERTNTMVFNTNIYLKSLIGKPTKQELMLALSHLEKNSDFNHHLVGGKAPLKASRKVLERDHFNQRRLRFAQIFGNMRVAHRKGALDRLNARLIRHSTTRSDPIEIILSLKDNLLRALLQPDINVIGSPCTINGELLFPPGEKVEPEPYLERFFSKLNPKEKSSLGIARAVTKLLKGTASIDLEIADSWKRYSELVPCTRFLEACAFGWVNRAREDLNKLMPQLFRETQENRCQQFYTDWDRDAGAQYFIDTEKNIVCYYKLYQVFRNPQRPKISYDRIELLLRNSLSSKSQTESAAFELPGMNCFQGREVQWEGVDTQAGQKPLAYYTVGFSVSPPKAGQREWTTQTMAYDLILSPEITPIERLEIMEIFNPTQTEMGGKCERHPSNNSASSDSDQSPEPRGLFEANSGPLRALRKLRARPAD